MPGVRTWLLAAACLAPHLARFLGPDAIYADGIYAHAVLMLARGHEPYVDYTQVAMLPVEALLAALVRLFGPRTEVFEVTQDFVILGAAFALRGALRRAGRPRAGALAALLWSWSPWVLHFNLFERETWSASAVALAFLAIAPYLPARGAAAVPLERGGLLRTGGALALAFAVKITSAASAVAFAAFLLASGRGRDALRLGLATAAIAGAAVAVHAAIWGAPFLQQVFVFGLFKGRNCPPGVGPTLLVTLADPVIVLGVAGLLLWALRRARGLPGLAAAALLGTMLYALVLSPTVWDHNMIDLVLPAAVLGGGLLDRLLPGRGDEDEEAAAAPGRSGGRPRLALVAGTVAVAAAFWVGDHFVPFTRHEHALAHYGPWGPGFGGTSREVVALSAAVLAAHSRPDELVLTTDPWVSCLANRVEFARYWDIEPVMHGVERSLEADGLLATLAKSRDAIVLGPGRPPTPPGFNIGVRGYVDRLNANTVVYMRPRLLEALAARRIAFLQWPFLPPSVQELVLTVAELEALGYKRFRGTQAAGCYRPVGGATSRELEPMFGPTARRAEAAEH